MADMVSSNRPPDFRLLIALNRIVGVLSVLAAIVLYTGEKMLGIPGLAAAPHHEPLIVHCLLTALLLFWANADLGGGVRRGKSSVLRFVSWIILAAVAIVDLFLAGSVLFDFSLARAPVLLLVVPAVQCGWSLYGKLEKLDYEKESANGESAADEDAEGSLEGEEPAAGDERPSFVSILRFALVYSLLMGLVIYMLVPGAVYFHFLRDAIFEQNFRGWAHFLRWLSAALREKLWFMGLIAGVQFLSITAYFAIAAWHGRRDQRYQDRLRRELDPHKYEFVETAYEDVVRFADTLLGRVSLDAVSGALMLGFTGLWFAGLILAFPSDTGSGWGAALFEDARTRGLEWALYLDERGVAEFLAIFLTLPLLLVTVYFGIGFFWRDWAAHVTLGIRKRDQGAGNLWQHYRRSLVRDLRRGRIGPDTGFDPAAYVRRDFRRVFRLITVLTGIVVAVNSYILYLDRMDYDLLTKGYIEYTDYWTSEVHRMGYGDVDRVEVVCALDEDEDDDDLELSYILKFGDDRTIRVVDLDAPREFRAVLPERLPAWTKADAKLRAAGVPVRHEVKAGKGRRQSRFDERECRAGLDGLVGPAVRKKIMPLLRPSRGGDIPDSRRE